VNQQPVHEPQHSSMNIERTDKTVLGALMSILLTFLAVMIVGSAAAALLGAPTTGAVMGTVVITALAGGIIDIEVTY